MPFAKLWTPKCVKTCERVLNRQVDLHTYV